MNIVNFRYELHRLIIYPCCHMRAEYHSILILSKVHKKFLTCSVSALFHFEFWLVFLEKEWPIMDVAEISLLKNKMKLPNMAANNEIFLSS